MSGSKQLHIVTHDVPWPVDHGGYFDLFYKLKALHEQGVDIHLHCFTSGRAEQKELEKYCLTVRYYPRKKSIAGFSWRLPFIVSSRICKQLIEDLNQDAHPVLFDGIHTTHCLFNGKIRDRIIVVRLHNAEYEYYRNLASHEKNFLRRSYYNRESRLLKAYEKAIARKAVLLAVSEQDVQTYRDQFGAREIGYLPVFLPYSLAAGKEGKGYFCLYHGNLAVNENEEAVIWLLENVIDMPFIIAGRNPSKKLEKLAQARAEACLVANPSDDEMKDLIAKAQIHLLPSFNNTGVKLKLLNALFNGRHCIVNSAAVAGSRLKDHCHIADDPAAFREKISELFTKDFTEQELQKRQGLLQHEYNNQANAKKLMKILGW